MIYYQIIREDKYSIYDYISLNLKLIKESIGDKYLLNYKISIIYIKDLKEYTKENENYPGTYYKVLTIKEKNVLRR